MTNPNVDHPEHYGGKDNPYEAIKVIEDWGLGFCLGNAVKYISRAGKKEGATKADDLQKAAWYVDRYNHSPVERPTRAGSRDPAYHPHLVAEAWGLSDSLLEDVLNDIYHVHMFPRDRLSGALKYLHAVIEAEENPC
jgi:hypothetical protein